MRPIHHLMLSSVSFAALALVASPASAQTPDPVNPERDPCQAPADQRDPNLECPPADSPAGEAINQGVPVTTPGDNEVVVVGSRIRRDRFNTADPVTILTRDAAVDAGFNSTAEVLQSVGVTGGTAQIGDAYGGLVVEGGPGVNTLSLRGLGPTRTLVLLNGRRLAPAGTRGQVGAADLNVLPNAILDRIEVLNTGASSIYGSDAVAGVVNIVTRSRFDGLTLEANVTPPEIGAGTSQRYSAVFGTSGDRFSLLGSLEYYKRDRITFGDQPWARCPRQLYTAEEGGPRGEADFIDPLTGESKCFPLEEGGVTVNTIGTGAVFITPGVAAPGVDTTLPGPGFFLLCNRFRPNAAQLAGPFPGMECVTALYFRPNDPNTPENEQLLLSGDLNPRNTFAPSMLDVDLISPVKTYTGFLTGTYDTDFFGDGQLYAELLVHRRKSQQNSQRQFTLDYPVGSPLITAGGAFATLPPVVSTGLNIGVRTFADYGIYDSRQQQDYVKLSGGFRGDVPFMSQWRYDLYGSKSWSDGEYIFEQIISDRLAQSLNVVPGSTPGTFNCAVTVGGCVAAPALTPAIIAGQFRTAAPAWFDYVTEDVIGTTEFREWTGNLTVDGPLFRLPGGDAQAALGLEYRDSSIRDIPSPDSISGNLHGFSSAPTTIGSDSVWEAFGEVELPIVRDLPFAQALTVNLSGRYTDYESYGSGTTYKVGALYSPTRWLSFRGSYGTSYRAPALFEQFLGSTSGFQPNTTDPCHELSQNDIAPVIARCQAEGLPFGFTQNSSVQVNQLGGAEVGLEAETSKNLTLGAVLQPTLGPAFGNFSLAVDYFRVEVNEGVAQLALSTLTTGCYSGTRPEYCQFITRAPFTGPGTGALTVNQQYINIATDIVRGIDFVLRYDRELGPGRLDLGAQAVRIFDRINQTDPDSEATDFVGSIGNPKWAAIGHVGYETGPWYFRWGSEFIKGTSDNFLTDDLGFPRQFYDFSVPNYWLHTATTRYETDRYSLTLGVRNVFDKDPPVITSEDPFVNTAANVPLQGGFDFRGRTFFVNVRAKVF